MERWGGLNLDHCWERLRAAEEEEEAVVAPERWGDAT